MNTYSFCDPFFLPAMGDVYRTGIRPVEQDEEKALEYYKEALKIGRQESRADYIFVSTLCCLTAIAHFFNHLFVIAPPRCQSV